MYQVVNLTVEGVEMEVNEELSDEDLLVHPDEACPEDLDQHDCGFWCDECPWKEDDD